MNLVLTANPDTCAHSSHQHQPHILPQWKPHPRREVFSREDRHCSTRSFFLIKSPPPPFKLWRLVKMLKILKRAFKIHWTSSQASKPCQSETMVELLADKNSSSSNFIALVRDVFYGDWISRSTTLPTIRHSKHGYGRQKCLISGMRINYRTPGEKVKVLGRVDHRRTCESESRSESVLTARV